MANIEAFLIIFVRSFQFFLRGFTNWLGRETRASSGRLEAGIEDQRDRWLSAWAENFIQEDYIQEEYHGMELNNLVGGDLLNELEEGEIFPSLEEGEIFEGQFRDVWWEESDENNEWVFWYNDPAGYNAEIAELFDNGNIFEFGENFGGENWGENWGEYLAETEERGILEYNLGDILTWDWHIARQFFGYMAMAA